jgi:glutaredoxin 3
MNNTYLISQTQNINIKGNKMLTIYSKNNCSYCTQAKDLLTRRNVEFTEVKIDEDATARAFIVGEGHRTVPQIYNGDTLFVSGGYMGLLNLSPTQLDEMLNKEQVC